PHWDAKLSAEENYARFPLWDVWEKWYSARPRGQKDKDGMELYRAEKWLGVYEWSYRNWKEQASGSREIKAAFDAFTDGHDRSNVRYKHQVGSLLAWLRRKHPEERLLEWIVDATEATFALVPKTELQRDPADDKTFRDWRDMDLFGLWASDLSYWTDNPRWTPELVKRYWGLMRWKEGSVPKAPRRRAPVAVLMLAYRHGAA